MKKNFFIAGALMTCFAVCLMVSGLPGKWKGSLKAPDGTEHEFHLVLNTTDGKTLTGTAQGEGPAKAIDDGTVNGNDFTFNVKNDDGSNIPVDGKYIAVGDSISLNFVEQGTKYHVTFFREDK